MVGFAWDRVKAGLPMPGVIVRGEGVTVHQAINDLLLPHAAVPPRTSRTRSGFCPSEWLRSTGPILTYPLWLDPTVRRPDALRSLLRPYPAGEVVAVPASEYVNNARNEKAQCLRS
jgi:hypothetical protein